MRSYDVNVIAETPGICGVVVVAMTDVSVWGGVGVLGDRGILAESLEETGVALV